MRRSPIGSITCSIKGPFVRASAARGEDIYLSQTFYSPANLLQIFNFFYKVAQTSESFVSQTFYSAENVHQIFNFFIESSSTFRGFCITDILLQDLS